MTQSRNRTRMELIHYARIVRIQWLIILLLIATIMAMAAMMPKAQAKQVPTKPEQQERPVHVTEDLAIEMPSEVPYEPFEPYEPTLEPLGKFKLTAYCACKKCCGKSPSDPAYGITATGTTATAGRTIAVDPSIIPYGTSVVINGTTYIAEDCGGAIKENRIDIYFDTHQEALEFGVQHVEIYTIKN